MSALDDARELGYEIHAVSGSVATEEEALAAARATADPAFIAEQAQAVTTTTVEQLSREGKLPQAQTDRRQLIEQIASTALDALTERASARVEFHERAVEIARQMPTVYAVSGFGISTYIAITDSGDGATATDADTLTSLQDPRRHSWRRLVHLLRDRRPDRADTIIDALLQIRAKRYRLAIAIQDDGTGLKIDAEGRDGTVAVSMMTIPQILAAARDLPELPA